MTASGDSSFDMLQWVSDDVRGAFAAAVGTQRFSAGNLIYAQGDPGDTMFRVIEGSVRLSVRRADGREVLYLLFEPGDCFGVSSCVDGEPRPQTAEAGSDTILQILGPRAFAELRRHHRSFDDALMRLLSRHMRLLSDYFANASLDALSSRVAARLVGLARSFGVSRPDGISVRIPQSEIALMVGASRQSVNKLLRQFQEQRILTIDYGHLLIRDLPRLAGMAAG